MKRIVFTVTNELRYDQRMQRICRSLSNAGYKVTLIGYNQGSKPSLLKEPYQQKRLGLLFRNGALKFAEYNIRLFFVLLWKRADLICAIDLDTIVPVYFASLLKGCKRVYDAHELFTEQKEITTRPRIRKVWQFIERKFVPRFKNGYSVAESIVEHFRNAYGVNYRCIRNLPILQPSPIRQPRNDPPQLLYFGAVNEARGFEYLIPAMKHVNAELLICGNGNFFNQLQELIRNQQVEAKVTCMGMQPPEKFLEFTANSFLGLCLYENVALNHYYALPNKFFDYVQAGLPQLAMAYPEMQKVNAPDPVAVLISELTSTELAKQINNLLENAVLYSKLERNCLKARLLYNWEQEQPKLLSFYEKLFTA